MSISATSSSLASTPATSSLQATPFVARLDPDGDGDGGMKMHRSQGGGGHVRSAVMQALQSLGLALPAPASGAASADQTATTAASANAAPTSGASSVKHDLRQFMHQLFEAIKAESTASASSSNASAGSGASPSNFASGLSALISQVSGGTAPASLQSAFAKLVADLQPAGSAAPTTSGSTTGGNANASPATLQAFLTNLQQDLGYGASNSSAVGTLLTTQG